MIWRNLKHSLRGAWLEKNENERRIVLPGGGSITVKSADNPDSLRGAGLDGVVMDEASFMAREAWTEGIRPALADRQGWAIFAAMSIIFLAGAFFAYGAEQTGNPTLANLGVDQAYHTGDNASAGGNTLAMAPISASATCPLRPSLHRR